MLEKLNHVRPCQVMSDYFRLCLTMSDYVGLCLIVSDYVRLCEIMSEIGLSNFAVLFWTYFDLCQIRVLEGREGGLLNIF